MIDRQNIVAETDQQDCDSTQLALLALSQSRVVAKQAKEDEESCVSTDSDPYLDSEEEDLDIDDYRSTYSTFSALLIRRLEAIQEQQVLQECEDTSPNGPIRPPLLTTSDDSSFSAKMERVKKWARSVSTVSSEAASERDYTPPSMNRKRRLSDASSAEDASIKRARTSDTPSLVPDSPPLSSMTLYPHSAYTPSKLDQRIPQKRCIIRIERIRPLSYPPYSVPHRIYTTYDTTLPTTRILRRPNAISDANK